MRGFLHSNGHDVPGLEHFSQPKIKRVFCFLGALGSAQSHAYVSTQVLWIQGLRGILRENFHSHQ